MLEESKNIDSSLEPLDEYIVIQPVSDETETRAGLILPASALAQTKIVPAASVPESKGSADVRGIARLGIRAIAGGTIPAGTTEGSAGPGELLLRSSQVAFRSGVVGVHLEGVLPEPHRFVEPPGGEGLHPPHDVLTLEVFGDELVSGVRAVERAQHAERHDERRDRDDERKDSCHVVADGPPGEKDRYADQWEERGDREPAHQSLNPK